MMSFCVFFFFFSSRRRHTRCSRDWSSDVCSSDLERIIQRAAELQAGEQDIGDGLTEPELLALGKDVGIPARYLRQALLEEQTRAPDETRGGLLAWLVGPGRLSAQRVVAGDPAAVDRALGAWMQQDELLQVKRRYPDHTTWEPKVGAFAS